MDYLRLYLLVAYILLAGLLRFLNQKNKSAISIGLYFGIAFTVVFNVYTLIYEAIVSTTFIESVKTDYQPYVFFSLALLALTFVIPQRILLIRNLSQINPLDHLYVYWLAVLLPIFAYRIVDLFQLYGLFNTVIILLFYCIYNLPTLYFILNSFENSKFGMFAAVIYLIYDLFIYGVVAHGNSLKEIVVPMLALTFLNLFLAGMLLLKNKGKNKNSNNQ